VTVNTDAKRSPTPAVLRLTGWLARMLDHLGLGRRLTGKSLDHWFQEWQTRLDAPEERDSEESAHMTAIVRFLASAWFAVGVVGLIGLIPLGRGTTPVHLVVASIVAFVSCGALLLSLPYYLTDHAIRTVVRHPTLSDVALLCATLAASVVVEFSIIL
jgi:hypothetical protein